MTPAAQRAPTAQPSLHQQHTRRRRVDAGCSTPRNSPAGTAPTIVRRVPHRERTRPAMSLTSHLGDSSSPIRRWFEARLPNTRGVVSNANKRICGDPRRPCPLAPPTGSDSAVVGTALDFVVRSSLRADALQDTFATRGAAEVAKWRGCDSVRIEREAVEAISALSPSRRKLAPTQLAHLCRMCVVLARFEQFFRVGPRVWGVVGHPLADGPTLKQYASRVAGHSTLEDLLAVASVALRDHGDLRTADPLDLNPTFALSCLLGGADADVIACGLLLDFKSTAQSRAVRRNDIWQLVGYALCDVPNAFAIHSVGLSLIRWRAWVTWPLDELLNELADGDAQSPKLLRDEFHEAASDLQRLARSHSYRSRGARDGGS